MVESRKSRRLARRHRRSWVAAGIALLAALMFGGAAAAVIASSGGGTSRRMAVSTTTTTRVTTVPSSVTDSPAPTSEYRPSAGSLSAAQGKTIVIDPGHNGKNSEHAKQINEPVDIGTQTRACDTTGAQTDDGYTEAEYNFDVSLRLADLLRQAGANVVLTRSDNNGWGPCINERADIGNRALADLGISIHADGGPPGGRGFHVIYPPSIPGLTDGIATDSKRLADDTRSAYQAGTGLPYATYIGDGDGLSERSDLGGLNLSKVPKVFVETGNMRNAGDAALLKSDTFRQRAAMAIANGLAAYLAGQ